ncbi:DUF885 domain-containing protein [Pedomonas sp. V897]|uniref:DUF885 domain-containing protein n=1 Tax=Pedomonas sp. V897 TaxID=3446482 RepID=UPI003EDEA396
MRNASLMFRVLLASAAIGALPAVAVTATTATAAEAPAANSADARLRSIYEAEWKWRQAEFGRGEEGGAHLPRVDAATQQKRLAYWENVLKQLEAIPVDQLSPEERINYDVFYTMVWNDAVDLRYKAYEAPFNADTFFWTGLKPWGVLRTRQDYQDYISRLREVPRYFDEHMTNMRAGIKRGFTVPRVSIEGRDKTMEPYLRAGEDNPLFEPFERMPDNIPEAEREKLKAEALKVIREVVAPAYKKLHTMFVTEYMPKARTTIAAKDLPNGDAYYQDMVRKFTTLNITAKEIHEIGLKEVERITAAMEETKKKAGFNGTLAEFKQFLRTDPQFYAKTPKELLSLSAYVSKKADAALKTTIATLPRYRHGIIPVPEALAPIYTGGRGGLENCMMNTYNLPARSLFNIPALTLHECTPGHSFQAALALEAPERPDFRKNIYFSGYGEGWGLYTEYLGYEMGIYETPYEEFGQLSYEMWRATRLVVDTGIHQFGWTRQQAIDYLMEKTALTEHEVINEIDRYIAWPGQAVAYKLGELTIRRLRKEAEAALGENFDKRYFHDVILQLGAVPLSTLEDQIKKFIANGGRAPGQPNS